MVERYKRGKGKHKLMGNHQKCWVWGRNLILETLRSGSWPIQDLWLSDALSSAELQTAQDAAAANGVTTNIVTGKELKSRCHSAEHQGYAARMMEFPYATPNDLEQIVESTDSPLIAVCDSVQDPFNFGATIRTAEVMAVDAVVIGTTHQVGVTSMVARASVGAVNHIPIVRVDDIASRLISLNPKLQIIGASEKSDLPVFEHDLTVPTAVVIGNEGRGISPELLKICDALVQIPQAGAIDSLNAAVSASIFFYEARRQRMQS